MYDMILIDGECNKNASAVARLADNKHFPKISSFFTKRIFTLTLQMYCGLHFQFRPAHYHS
jgi:hypothetical protein